MSQVVVPRVRRRRPTEPSWSALAVTIIGSLGVHAALGVVLALLGTFVFSSSSCRGKAAEPIAARPPPLTEVELIELPPMSDLAEEARVGDAPPDPLGTPPHPSGGALNARMDTGSAGHGGDVTVRQQALNMSDGDEQMRLSPDTTPNHLERDQVQRLDVKKQRQSWEDRRATTHPTELTFIATGQGALAERRPNARDPSRGARESARASLSGSGAIGHARGASEGELGKKPNAGGARVGAANASPGVGVANAAPGTDHRLSASVASARPDVKEAPVAVPANVRDRPQDDVDTQQVTNAVASLVHASTAGGRDGEGRGGTGGGGDPGAGAAEGRGSRSHALGVGEGDSFDLYTTDPRLVAYFRRLKGKIDPLWAHAFPKSAMLELKQGTVILEFIVSASGAVSVSWPPVRPSGIDEFDRNCADAIRRAGPFPPIPPELGRSVLRIRAPFVATNPVIR